MLDVAISVFILVLAVALVRRLLGIDRGRWGVTLVAVLLGESFAALVLRVTISPVTDLPPRALFGALALVTVFTMLIVALVELAADPTRRRRAHHIPHLIGGTRRLVGRTIRYARVSAMAVRHGLIHPGGEDAEVRGTRLGHALSATFEDAGGLFVKLGQAMAAQPHLVTRSVAAELARLQDQVSPADPTAARAIIEEELGPPQRRVR